KLPKPPLQRLFMLPVPQPFFATITLPAAAATTGVPVGAARSTALIAWSPWLSTLPGTGLMNMPVEEEMEEELVPEDVGRFFGAGAGSGSALGMISSIPILI